MSIDSLKSLLEDFNPASFLPELDTLLGKIEMILRIVVTIGPVVMLVMGLIYLFLSPKEANYTFGYRCYFGMGSVEAWQFTQKLAGIVWGGLGLILTIIMLLIVNRYRLMDAEAMLWSAIRCIAWEAGLAAASALGINIAVMCLFDRKGDRRSHGAAVEEPEESPTEEETIEEEVFPEESEETSE